MEKYTYFVLTEKEEATGKFYSWAEKVHNHYNLLGYFTPTRYPGKGAFVITTINVCDTWKEAQHIADIWNESYRNNGTYAFA